MERIIKQKTAEAIKKLEKQFKLTYMAYTSTNDKGKKLQAHKKLQGKTSEVYLACGRGQLLRHNNREGVGAIR